MSSAFGDFGPLTERRKAEKARETRKRLMIAGGVIAVILIVCGVAIMYNGKKDEKAGGSGSKKGSSSSKGKSGGGSGSGSGSGGGSASPVDLKAVSKSITVLCKQTDYPDACQESLTRCANASASSPKDLVRTAVQVIGDGLSQAYDRADLIMSNDPSVKAAVDECKQFFEYSKEELNRTISGIDASKDSLSKQGLELRIWLSSVIAYQETCIDGFPDGEFKDKVKESFVKGKELTSNALQLIEKAATFLAGFKIPQRRLLVEEGAAPRRAEPVLGEDGIPKWVPESERRVLKGGGFKSDIKPSVVVAKDGSGKFKTINEALAAMPKTYTGRYVIYVKEGVYEEYVTITKKMANVTLTGDGSKKTIITGKKNFADGVKTFMTATFSALGNRFMAVGIGFQNTAGAEKHQAVALLVTSDQSIFLNCRMDGFQDTLYAHSGAQFYRNCIITGTIDFIFGDASAMFQNCIITLRRPMDNQQNIVTAQGRALPTEPTGFVLQKCEINGESALTAPGKPPIKNYLGRPWKECSRTIIMESEIPAIIDKEGYMPWQGDFALKTLFYAEYGNKGPGADTAARVTWPGYKKTISKQDATKFTLENFLPQPRPWIDPTGTPVKYDFFG